MGIWIELGIFLVVIVWGFWQLHAVKQAKAQRLAEEARKAREATGAAASSPSDSQTGERA